MSAEVSNTHSPYSNLNFVVINVRMCEHNELHMGTIKYFTSKLIKLFKLFQIYLDIRK